jgi:hypothetical protein
VICGSHHAVYNLYIDTMPTKLQALRARLAQTELELKTLATRTRHLMALRRAIRRALARIDGPSWARRR